jgi:hypothetical protein
VVVSEVLIQGSWDPSYFINTFDDEGVTLINCETGETKKSTVKEYFETFLNPTGESGIWKLKVAYQVFSCCFGRSHLSFVRLASSKKLPGHVSGII